MSWYFSDPYKKSYDLGITPILLNPRFPREPNAARPLDRLPRDTLRDDTAPILRHRRLLHEVLTLLLPARSVVREQPRALDVDGGLRDLERHALERADGLPKLRPRIRIGNGLVEGALREPKHLPGDADAAYSVVSKYRGRRLVRGGIPSFKISMAI